MADSTRASRTKILFAVAGGGAVVAMAGLTVVFDQGAPSVLPAVAAPVLPGPMTQGDTVTTTIAPAVLATAKARPAVKAKHFGE
ncbi:Rare lipoprotein A [uncultured Mycobacterium sp.]|uniref:Rare lipoprotein A n=1 Tax=uncultured Mycobacterium sp. TaxID=171292 RepID=A0A1Y5PDX0_9MYCO|nr:Rare lipoprotein A [uncultured Mycobacterium sp.]